MLTNPFPSGTDGTARGGQPVRGLGNAGPPPTAPAALFVRASPATATFHPIGRAGCDDPRNTTRRRKRHGTAADGHAGSGGERMSKEGRTLSSTLNEQQSYEIKRVTNALAFPVHFTV